MNKTYNALRKFQFVVQTSILVGMALLALPALAMANADVEKNIANTNNWATQAGDMYNQRYSKLKQINPSHFDVLS